MKTHWNPKSHLQKNTRISIKLLTGVLALVLLASACGSSDDATTSGVESPAPAPASPATTSDSPATTTTAPPATTTSAAGGDTTDMETKATLRVALLLPGIMNDNSFSQAAAEGINAAAAADGNIEYQILDELSESSDSLPAIRGFARQGYDLIIGHGIEYVDPIMDLYEEFPDVNFAMTGGVLSEGADVQDNVVDWLYNVQDMAYPNGLLAANAIVGDTIGIVGGPEWDFVRTMHAAFRQAVTSVNPDIDFLEGFVGDFVNVQKAAEVTTSLIDQGAELIYCSGDGICIGAAQAASAAGIPLFVGFGSQMESAPDVYIGATVIRLSDTFQMYFNLVRSGDFGNAFFPGSIQNGGIEVLPINMSATVETAISLEELQQIQDEFVAQVESGEFEIPFPVPPS